MLDEDGLPVEKEIASGDRQKSAGHPETSKPANLFYLHIPAGKSRGPFWIWIPEYVAEAISVWKKDRPQHQRKLLDQKDGEEVDYLFCYREARVGATFITYPLIPTLCAKIGM